MGIEIKAQLIDKIIENLRYSDSVFQEQDVKQHIEGEEHDNLAEIVQDIVIIVAKDGKLLFVNASAERILGHDADKIADNNLFDFIHPDDEKRTASDLREIVQKAGESKSLSFRLRHRDGSWIVLKGRGKNLKDQEGNASVVINSPDISACQMLENKLRNKELYYQARIRELEEANVLFKKGISDQGVQVPSHSGKGESDKLYKNLVENANIGIMIDDEKGNITYFNSQFLRIFGYTDREMLKLKHDKLVHPDDVIRLKKIHSDRLKGKKAPKTYEFKGIKRDGTPIWIKVVANEMIEDGKITGSHCCLWDITERRKTEEQLRLSEERLRILFENAPDAYYLNDLKGTFLSGNRAAEKITGYKREELIGKNFLKLNLLAPGQKTKAAALLAKNILGKPTGPDQIGLIRKDGSRVTVEIMTHPTKIDDKACVLAIARDITKWIQAKRSIAESEEKFRSIFNNVTDGLVYLDDAGRILDVNDQSAAIFGGAKEDLIGKHFTRIGIFSVKNIPALIRNFKEAFSQQHSTIQIMIKNKKGQELFLECETSVMVSDTGGKRVVVVVRDITERKKTEDALRESRDKLSGITDSTQDAIIMADQGGNATFWNLSAEKIFGYSEKSIQGCNLVDAIISKASDKKFLSEIRNLRKSGNHNRKVFEFMAIRKDGKEFPIEISLSSLKMDHKWHWIGVVRDISERKLSEERLNSSEEKFRTLAEESPNMIYIKQNGAVVYINKKFEEMIGYRDEEPLSLDFVKLLDLGCGEIHTDMCKHKLGELTAQHECSFISKTGEKTYVLSQTKSIDYHGNQATLGILTDITAQKLAEADLQQGLINLKTAFKGTIRSLSSAVEKRDPYTSGHQQHVADLVCAIADEMGLPDENVEAVRMAGIIHDIGKLYIPAEILSKPTRLTETEMLLVQQHPKAGYDILKEIEFPWPIARIVLQHHERQNGTGYPAGISGDDIILEAKILGVADVVEAMTFHRPYRPARGLDKALEELEQNRGILYDSRVVDACLRIMKEKKFTFVDKKNGAFGFV